MLGVNLGGVVNGVVTFVPRIKAHGEGGHVVNTASMAAFVAGPGAGIYTTAKFAVHGLSDALRWSLLPHGIGVSMVCPGLVKSKIYESDLIRPAELSTDVTPGRRGVHAHPPGPARGRDGPGRDRREGAARDQAERLLRLHPPRPPGGAAGDLRRDPRRVPRRAGARRTGWRSRRAGARGRPRPSPPGRATGRRMEEVAGKTAFVTGGASGIGLGMAEAFVAAGMNVVIADLRPDHVETALATLRRDGARARPRDRARRHRPRGVRARGRRGGARLRQRPRALQQRRHGHPRAGHARRATTTGTGASACCSAASSTGSRRSCRGCSRTARAGTSSTPRRWPASSRSPAPRSTSRPRPR